MGPRPDLEVGTDDGAVWFVGVEPPVVDGVPVLNEEDCPPGDSLLMRLDGGQWQRWGPADGVPSAGWGYGTGLKQAPDGALWVATGYYHEPPVSEGIGRFDEKSWLRYLQGHTVESFDIAQDGSVWLMAKGPGGSDLYVITPEAVAATE